MSGDGHCNRITILRHPNQVILAVPDRVAAALVALHAPVYTGHVADPMPPKGVGFPDPLSGTLNAPVAKHRRATGS